MSRRRLPCPVGSSSGELLGVGHKAKVPALWLLAILLLNGVVASLFALGDTRFVFLPSRFGSEHSLHSKISSGLLA